MARRRMRNFRVFMAICAALVEGCGDGSFATGDNDAPDALTADADAADADAQPGTDAVDGGADLATVETATTDAEAVDAEDAEVAAPADATADAEAPDAADAATDTAEPDAVDAAADVQDAATVDAAGDAMTAGDADATPFDPNCPYDPKTLCLHWGVCKNAKVKVDCSSGEPVCDYAKVPGYEVIEKSCDGLDNDCNNLVDDSLNVPLASKQAGICQGQVKSCEGAAGWQDPNFALVSLFQPVETACDGQDNDCDGETDVFLNGKPLIGQQGVCADGYYTCGGVLGWQLPDVATLPFWEPIETMCDGLDNDCDGLTDEDMDTPNFLGSGVKVNNQGVCNGALIRCLQGVWSPPDYSQQVNFEAAESSCDGLDNDCNGVVDDIVPALASKQAGVCIGQLVVCNGKIGWQDPDWTLLPGYATDTEWQCDGLDNDCDGLTDEDAACPLWQSGGRGTGKVALSPDGQHIAWTTLQGAQVVGWQSHTVERDWFGHNHAVTAVAFSADGTRLATTGQLDVLQVWPLSAPVTPAAMAEPVLAVGGLGTTFAAVAFSPDGGQVAVGDATGTVRVYALWSGQQVAALVGHKAQVAAMAWLPDAQGGNGVLVTGDDGGMVRRWQVATQLGEQMALLQGGVRTIAAMPATSQVMLVAEDQAIVVDAASGEPLAQLQGGKGTWAGGALRPDQGGEALLLRPNGTIQRFPLPQPSGQLVDVTPVQTIAPPPEVFDDSARSLSAQAGHVAVGFTAQGPWQLDVASGVWSRAVARHDGAVQDAAIAGSMLLTGGDDTAIHCWRTEDARALLDLWGHQGSVLTLQPLKPLPLAPPGSDLATILGKGLALASGSDDFSVRLWTVAPTPTGIGVLTPKIFGLGGPWPTDLALTADVPGIWAAGGPTLSKVSTDAATLGQKLNAYPTKLGNIIERVVPSPDGQWLALGMSGDGSAANIHYRIIAAKTFAVLHEWSGMPAPVHAIAWSGDGSRVALAGPDGVIQVAEVQSGAVVQQLFGHQAAITSLTWSPAGRLLSTSEDGTARVWSTAVNKPILQLAAFSRHCPTPCTDATGAKVAVLGGLWQDAQARLAITFGSDGSLFAWKGPASP